MKNDITDILFKYTTGEATLEETNEALKEAEAGFHLEPGKNEITPEEAAQTDNSLLQLGQVAQEESISPGYLEQIVRALKPLGILRAVRGSGGGYALSKPPSEINMEDVFLHLEGEISPVSCLGRGKVCQREGLCSTRAFWHQLDEHVRDFLRHQTLQNIIESERSCCQDPGEHHVELH